MCVSRLTHKSNVICGVMVSKLDWQTYTSEFESHWVPLSYVLVPHLSKKLSKFPYICTDISSPICYHMKGQ